MLKIILRKRDPFPTRRDRRNSTGAKHCRGRLDPYKPEALIKRNENFANRLKLDPEIKCYMPVCLAGRTCPSHYRLTSLKRTSCLRTNTRPRIGRQHGPSQISGRGRVDGNIEWTMAGRHAGR